MNSARFLLLALPLVASCRHAAAPVPHVDPCVVAERPAPAAPLSVAGVRVQPSHTLVRVDCTGAVRPGLALSWSDSAGLFWRFRLDPRARLPDGTAITAHEVMGTWSSSRTSAAILNLSAAGPYELHVELRAPARAELFADSILALPTENPAFTRTALTGRDAVDAAIDLVATADRDVVEYARARGDYAAVPLPITRTYVIAAGGPAAQRRIPEEVANALSRDVVGGNARAATEPFWWEHGACVVRGPTFRTRPEARDIVYARGDVVAQRLAERIVAQSWPRAAPWLQEVLTASYGASAPPRAVALDESSLLAALRARVPLAVIMPMPRLYDSACLANASPLVTLLAAGWQITPLVDVHEVLLHRDRVGVLATDAFGAIRDFRQ